MRDWAPHVQMDEEFERERGAACRARTECSESAGRMLTPCSRASGSTYGPPAISVSLFARQMSLPALMAATVGCNPAQPAG